MRRREVLREPADDLGEYQARTAYTPKMEATTPMARAATGNTRPSAGFMPIERKAATPRMIDATSVTS